MIMIYWTSHCAIKGKIKGLINMIKKLIILIRRHPKVVEKREPEVLINSRNKTKG